MKNLFKKIIKMIPYALIAIFVFVGTFILINYKVNLNSDIKNINSLNAQSFISGKIQEKSNLVAPENKTVKKSLFKNESNNVAVYPYYYGVGKKDLTPLEISKLTKVNQKYITPLSLSFSPVDQVWYLAYPDSFPALTSIKDQNGFELISDFKVTNDNVIIDSVGNKKSYRVYEYINMTTLSEYKVTYK